MKIPKILSEKTVFRGKVCQIKRRRLRLTDGRIFEGEFIKRGPTALIVPVDQNGNVYFVEEYFVAHHARLLGLPKGQIRGGKSALKTANQELQEEIGLKAGKFTQLAEGIIFAPGYHTQQTTIYLATELTPARLPPDEIEPIKVVKYPLKNFLRLVKSGRLKEARAITALLLAKDKLKI